MATTVSFNGTSYSVPATGERAWGGQVSAYLIALATGTLQKVGGTFTLTAADVDFGATYGLKAAKFSSRSTPSTTGIVRLGNNESVAWRNAANGADLALKLNASNVLEFDGTPIVTLALGTAHTALRMNAGGTAYAWALLLDANIDAAAAIAWTKVSKTGSNLTDLATRAHTDLTAIGTNTHAQIDTAITTSASHIASTSNPHSTTATQLGLGNVDNTSDVTKNAASVTLTNKTLTAPVINSPTGIVKADVGLGNVDNTSDTTKNSASATLTNKTIAGASNTITVLAATQLSGATPIANGGTGQTTANAATNALLPSQATHSGKVLSTDATNTSWISVLTSPMTTRGDLIRGGTSGVAERVAAVTNNRVVRGNGTDVVSGQIDAPGFFTTGAAASSTDIGIVTVGAQTIFGPKTITGTTDATFNINSGTSGSGPLLQFQRAASNKFSMFVGDVDGDGNSSTNGLSIYDSTALAYRFRITSTGSATFGAVAAPVGSVSILADTDAGLLDIRSLNATDANDRGAGVYIRKRTTTTGTTQTFMRFFTGVTTANGSITGNGAEQAIFTNISDERLKENIVSLPSQLSNIMSLRPVEFDYKNGSGHQIGFIAQEVAKIYPDLVSADEKTGYLSLAGLGKGESRLIKAMQEQQQIILSLSVRIEALEAK